MKLHVKMQAKLRVKGLKSCAPLSSPLQIDYRVNEGRIGPWLGDSLRLLQRNDVRGRLFHDTEAFDFQLAQERSFSGTGCAGQNESLHGCYSSSPGSGARSGAERRISRNFS